MPILFPTLQRSSLPPSLPPSHCVMGSGWALLAKTVQMFPHYDCNQRVHISQTVPKWIKLLTLEPRSLKIISTSKILPNCCKETEIFYKHEDKQSRSSVWGGGAGMRGWYIPQGSVDVWHSRVHGVSCVIAPESNKPWGVLSFDEGPFEWPNIGVQLDNSSGRVKFWLGMLSQALSAKMRTQTYLTYSWHIAPVCTRRKPWWRGLW